MHRADKQIYDLNEFEKLSDLHKDIVIDDGISKIDNVLKNCKLIINSYDSTTMREAIACEFPNLSLLGEGMDHLNDFAKNDYQNLVDIGMIYFSPELIAEKVNNEYYNIEDWWDNVRNNTSFLEFKEKYARPDQSIELLSSIIKN